jgi:hypothetical protein
MRRAALRLSVRLAEPHPVPRRGGIERSHAETPDALYHLPWLGPGSHSAFVYAPRIAEGPEHLAVFAPEAQRLFALRPGSSPMPERLATSSAHGGDLCAANLQNGEEIKQGSTLKVSICMFDPQVPQSQLESYVRPSACAPMSRARTSSAESHSSVPTNSGSPKASR